MPLIGSVTFLAGVLFFPISYIFGDILTEVYGYGRDRRVVWAGFAALAFASIMAAVVVHLPPSAALAAPIKPAVEAIFGNTPRIVVASIMRISLRHVREQLRARQDEDLDPRPLAVDAHRRLDLCGEFVDSVIFYFVAFYGRMPWPHLVAIMFTQYVLKSGWEIVAAPLTYRVVAFLKRAENEDYYDIGTNFTPFSLKA